MTIELSSHCDYKGNDDYNMRLSQRRAESVVNYLIAGGIEKERLTAKGYGESKPKVIRKRLAEKLKFVKDGDILTKNLSKHYRKSNRRFVMPSTDARSLPY